MFKTINKPRITFDKKEYETLMTVAWEPEVRCGELQGPLSGA